MFSEYQNCCRSCTHPNKSIFWVIIWASVILIDQSLTMHSKALALWSFVSHSSLNCREHDNDYDTIRKPNRILCSSSFLLTDRSNSSVDPPKKSTPEQQSDGLDSNRNLFPQPSLYDLLGDNRKYCWFCKTTMDPPRGLSHKNRIFCISRNIELNAKFAQ